MDATVTRNQCFDAANAQVSKLQGQSTELQGKLATADAQVAKLTKSAEPPRLSPAGEIYREDRSLGATEEVVSKSE